MAKPDPTKVADRSRASKLRKRLDRGEAVGAADAEFLKAYDAARSPRPPPTPIALAPVVAAAAEAGTDIGASESGREISFKLKENSKAFGTGEAASIAAGMAAMSKAQGEALKGMAEASRASLDILIQAVKTYRFQTLDLRELVKDLLQSELDARSEARKQTLARVQVEAELKRLAGERGEDDPVSQLLRDVATHVMQNGFGAPMLPAVNGAPRPPKARG